VAQKSQAADEPAGTPGSQEVARGCAENPSVSGIRDMRQPQRLSYSGFSLWETRPDEFYLKYLSDRRPPHIPQERPAAAGAAFDAYVKSALHSAIFGAGSDPKYQFPALFEAQVEPQNRDWALEEGEYVFNSYVLSGFYDKLLDLLKTSKEPPRFEFTVEAEINGVPFLGKPDARWVTPGGVPVIHDWKLNGFTSKYTTSPCRSYMRCRDGYVSAKPSKNHDTEHRAFLGYQHGDLTINTTYLEAANTAWADQLSLYGWALGEKIGDENVVLSIHQIVAKPADGRPQLRVAAYRARVQTSYQQELAARLERCWDAITSGHIFLTLSREDSDARCQVLDETAVGLQSDGSNREEYFNETTRDRYRG
jgi:hypothetical protein